jgi:hypothetical protein
VTEAANPQASIVLSADEGEMVWLRKLGIRFMIGGEQTQGNFSLVEHPIKPRALAAPVTSATGADPLLSAVPLPLSHTASGLAGGHP